MQESEKEMKYTSIVNPILSIDDGSSIPQTETERTYILVVDDDQSILSMLMSLLESEGYSSVGFSESQGVLPFLQEMGKRGERHLPALILLDLMMPIVSRYYIVRSLSDHDPYIPLPILIITPHTRVRHKNT